MAAPPPSFDEAVAHARDGLAAVVADDA